MRGGAASQPGGPTRPRPELEVTNAAVSSRSNCALRRGDSVVSHLMHRAAAYTRLRPAVSLDTPRTGDAWGTRRFEGPLHHPRLARARTDPLVHIAFGR